jgi:hypothetical protein
MDCYKSEFGFWLLERESLLREREGDREEEEERQESVIQCL